MSRLTDLIAQMKTKEPELSKELEKEFKVLASRRSFGLNFERHRPESVELPGRLIRKGDKVRVFPTRGSTDKGDQRLWKVHGFERSEGHRFARLELMNSAEAEQMSASVEDLVIVAEFQDYIYPGLISTGKVEDGGDKPYHCVINGENFHVLEALTYTHRGKVDLIYIDPPYNSGARDWKYNNDYVEKEDLYRHSKWLAFLERRLRVVKELLNPKDSVLIVTIDEKEYLRLGLLLEQTFEDGKLEMISSVINPKGTGRTGDFARTNEYIFFVRLGTSTVGTRPDDSSIGNDVSWETMRRRNLASRRGRKGKGACGPNQFYPIFVDETTGAIVGRGEPLPAELPRESIKPTEGTVAVFPVRKDGTEMNWEYKDKAFDEWWSKGYIRANGAKNEPQPYIIQHLPNKARQEVVNETILIQGKREDGSVIAQYQASSSKSVTTQWDYKSHSAEHGGTGILKSLIPGRQFPYPKSLYAVEDALRLFLGDKKNAIVLDFFAGSGTTTHAVMRLNRQDSGKRYSISVTNNEVAAEEHYKLLKSKLRPGDDDWEIWGICEYLTKPRIKAAMTGKSHDGKGIKGDYKCNGEFPMSDGFAENAEFFTLTYETPISISHNRAFSKIAPLLWMRAGSEGRRIDNIPSEGWEVVDTYGLLNDLDQAIPFCKSVSTTNSVRIAYVVTDDERRFQSVVRQLSDSVEPVRLYESYLKNFRFSMGR